MEQFLEKIAKAPLGTKLAVLTGICAVMVLLNYFWLPIGKSIMEIETQITRSASEQKKLDDQLNVNTAIANNFEQFKEEKAKLEKQLEAALSELPEEKKLAELLKEFQDRAAQAGLEIATIEPSEERREDFYVRIPIPMSVVGTYHEVATFFDAVSRMERIVNIAGINMGEPRDLNGKLVVNAKFVATTFMFLKKAPAPAGAGAKPTAGRGAQ